jgi:hypothetical protein
MEPAQKVGIKSAWRVEEKMSPDSLRVTALILLEMEEESEPWKGFHWFAET